MGSGDSVGLNKTGKTFRSLAFGMSGVLSV